MPGIGLTPDETEFSAGAEGFGDRLKKAPHAYRTISEVADELHVPQHVLRFWETRFAEVRPLKRGGGRRYYRPEDVDVLRRISELLYVQGYTIKGVQRVLREGEGPGAAPVEVHRNAGVDAPPDVVLDAPEIALDIVAGETGAIEAHGPDSGMAAPGLPPEVMFEAPAVDMPGSSAEHPPEQDVRTAEELAHAVSEADRLRAEGRMLRGQLRDVLEELQAIRASLPV